MRVRVTGTRPSERLPLREAGNTDTDTTSLLGIYD